MATKGKTGQVTALNNKWPALKQPLANAATKEGKLTKDSTNKDLYDSLSKVIKAAVADLYNTPQTDPRLVSIVRTIIAYVNGAVKQQIEDNSAIQDIVDNTSKDAISTIVEKAVEAAIKQNATSKDQTNKLADAIAKSVVKAISASKDKEKHDKLLADIKSMLEQQTSSTTSSNKIETKTSTAKTSIANLKSINDVLKKLMKICNNMQKLQTNISKNTNFIVKKLDATHIISTKMKKQVEQTTKIQQQIQTTTDEGFKSTNDNIEKVNNAVEEVNENIKSIQSGSLLSGVLGGSVGLAFKALGFIGKLVLAPAKFLFKWILKPIFGFVGGAIGGLLKGVSSILLAPIKLIGKGIGKVLDSIANVAAKSFGAFIMTPAGQYTIGFIAGFVWEMWLKDFWNIIKRIIDRISTFINDISTGKGISVAFKRLFFGEGAENISWSDLIKKLIFGDNAEGKSWIDLIKHKFEELKASGLLEQWSNMFKIFIFGEDAAGKSWSQLILGKFMEVYNSSPIIAEFVNKLAAKTVQSVVQNSIRVAKGISKTISVFKPSAKTTVKETTKIAEKTIQKGASKEVAKLAEKEGAKIAQKTVAKQSIKQGSKIAGKALAKGIWGIGALTGLYYAGKKALEGDWTGAALEATSGLVSLVPLVGTAASIAMDVGIGIRDYSKQQKNQQEQISIVAEKQKDTLQNVDEAIDEVQKIPNNLTEKAKQINEQTTEDYSAYTGWTFINGQWYYDGKPATKQQLEESRNRTLQTTLNLQRKMPNIESSQLSNLEEAADQYGFGPTKELHRYNNAEQLADIISNRLKDYQQDIDAMPATEQREWQRKLMDLVIKLNNAVNERSTQQNNYLFMEQPNQSLWNSDRTQ